MSRPWRIEFPGAVYHLLSRGNERRNIFEDDRDRQMFLDTVGTLYERFELEFFAYVLMPNHYHLLVRTRHANIKKAMHWFGTTYTQRFNVRHSRCGHLFQGRYKSFLVENDAYLIRLSCYIHRNPLRAGVTKRLAEYQWSSYPAYAYGQKSPEWLTTELILSHFGTEDQHQQYRKKVQSYAGEERLLWEDFHHGLFLGTPDFVQKVRRRNIPPKISASIPQQTQTATAPNPESLIKVAEQLLGCDVQRFALAGRVRGAQKEQRDIAIYLLWRSGRFSNGEIGTIFGISYSAVSHAVGRLKSKMGKNPHILEAIKRINSQFKL